MVICFVDIIRIVDHHFLHFLFVISIFTLATNTFTYMFTDLFLLFIYTCICVAYNQSECSSRVR